MSDWEDYSREKGLEMLLGTPWHPSITFEILDFLAICWFCIEYEYLRNVRNGMRDWAHRPTPGKP